MRSLHECLAYTAQVLGLARIRHVWLVCGHAWVGGCTTKLASSGLGRVSFIAPRTCLPEPAAEQHGEGEGVRPCDRRILGH